MSSGEGYSASEGGSRKRLKISRTDSRPVSSNMSTATGSRPVVISSDAPVKAEASTSRENGVGNTEQNGVHPHDGPCHHEASLRTLHTDLEAMRQLITCKICQHFLYEPYALTCGHTFCYSCLLQWMGTNQKKTCPDCRTVIKEEPSPSYLVRDMVILFGSRSELLADGETAEEHTQAANEEAELIASDKANQDIRTGGLFKGRFRKGSRFAPLHAIHDDSDHVDRCPQCASEIEDGWCITCDVRVMGEDDDLSFTENSEDEIEDELDHDLDDAELEEDMQLAYDGSEFGERLYDSDVPLQYDYAVGGAGGVAHYGFGFDSEEESEDDDDDLEGFVDDQVHYDDDADDGLSDSDDTAVATTGTPQPRRQGPIVLSDSDDDEIAPVRTRRRIVTRVSEEPSVGGASRTSDSESEDDEPIVTSQRSRHPRQITIDSDDEEDEDEEAAEDENGSVPDDEEARVNLANHLAIHGYEGFSSQSDDSEDEDAQGFGHDYQNENYGYDYGNHFDAQSAASDDSDGGDEDESEEEESEDNDQSTATGFEAISHPDLETCANQAAGTRATDPYSHRLHTLEPRHIRYASPAPIHTGAQPMSVADFNRRFASARHLRPQRSGDYLRPAANGQPQPFHHPFQLDHTLARLNREQSSREQDAPARYHRGIPSLSSQSSTGGVDVRESPSASSGSSRTIRGESEDEDVPVRRVKVSLHHRR